MPSFREVQYYLAGLWLLIQLDPRGFRYLDISDRGMLRSFWAILWCIPPILISWLQYKAAFLIAMPPGTDVGPGFFFRLGLIEATGWLVPLIFSGLLLLIFRAGEKFAPIVVTMNWLALPIAYVNALLIALLVYIPGAASMTAMLWLALLITMVFVIARILRMICGAQPLFVSALTLVILIPSMLLTFFLQKFLGVTVI